MTLGIGIYGPSLVLFSPHGMEPNLPHDLFRDNVPERGGRPIDQRHFSPDDDRVGFFDDLQDDVAYECAA